MLVGNFVSINSVISTAEISSLYFGFILTITRLSSTRKVMAMINPGTLTVRAPCYNGIDQDIRWRWIKC